jgi:hypothetical protein
MQRTPKLFLFFICLLLGIRTQAQYPCYKAITLKTNVLTLFNGSIDFPVYGRFTGEVGYRTFPGGGSAFYIPETRGLRFNVKYHFPFHEWEAYVPSFYVFSGVNSLRMEARGYDEGYAVTSIGKLDVIKVPVGVGLKFRRLSVWLAYEPICVTYENSMKYYRDYVSSPIPSSETRWKRNEFISVGVGLTLLNIKMPPRETTLYRWIGGM